MFVLAGKKGLTITRTLAYYAIEFITAVKSFIMYAPGVSAIKISTTMIFECL